MMLEIVDLAFAPLRFMARLVEHELARPLEETEHDVLDGVNAIRHATDSIEHHVEVIEGLATSVGPLTEAVHQLTATMNDLVALLAPMAAAEGGVKRAERDVERAERFFRFRHHKDPAGAEDDHAG